MRHFCIPHIFEQQHRLNLCYGFPVVPDEIILEFYANMFECNSLENSFRVLLCGNIFSIDEDVIATALEIPCVPKPGYLFRNDPDRDVVLSWFCGCRRCLGTSANAKTVGFTNEVCLLNKIMGACLFPLSYGNTIIVERAFFFYALLFDVPIDLTFVLCLSLLGVYSSHDYHHDLYLPITITCILIHFGFYLPTPFIELRVPLAFGFVTLKKMQAQLTKKERDKRQISTLGVEDDNDDLEDEPQPQLADVPPSVAPTPPMP